MKKNNAVTALVSMNTRCFIGTSGWDYPHWRHLFYPDELKQLHWLSWYAVRFNSVEINSTFYRLPSESTVQRWRDSVPEGFRISLKAPRTITHYKKLKDAGKQVKRFYRISSILGDKCGAHLFQLPASFCFDAENSRILAQFVTQLDPGRDNVIEFRNEGWWNSDCFELLRGHRVCFCAVDGFGMPELVPPYADIAYFRFHGSAYDGDYPEVVLGRYARIIENLDCSRIYGYFNNDVEARAVFNARTLAGMLGRQAGHYRA
jgi:uncharacterized protein YecE (DUF72 family)